MTEQVDDFLAHHGVIRKDPSAPPQTKTHDLPDAEKSKIRIR